MFVGCVKNGDEDVSVTKVNSARNSTRKKLLKNHTSCLSESTAVKVT
jgi:hypothetical protein